MRLLAVLLVLALALYFLRRPDERDRDGNPTLRLWAPAAVLLLVGVLGVAATRHHLADAGYRAHPERLALGLVFAATGLVGALVCLGYRVTLAGDALVWRLPPLRSRRFPLATVAGVDQSTRVSAVIRFDDGGRLAVPRMASGVAGFLPALAAALERVGRPVRLLGRIRRGT
jgi:hypothetical protein